jgi:hypothetical protein
VTDDLPSRILAHLTAYPDLTAHEIARALRLVAAGRPDQHKVKRALAELQGQGRVLSEITPKGPADRWAVTRWRTTQNEMAAAAAREGDEA